MVSSRSMPHLNNITVADEAVPEQHLSSLPIEEDRRLENTEHYREIVQICRHNRQHFIDDSFPHSARSIGSLDQLEKQNLSIIWLRPEQIVTKDGRMTRWSVFNDPQPTDIEQGFLGNCWFLSALAVVAERPDILERLFLTKQYNSVGVYEMRLCIDGIWQNVIVDDFFPCHKRGRAMVFGVGRKNQLWVSLVEKALAKVYGNYAVLRAGRTVEGLSTLTGAPTQSIDLEHTELGPEARQSAMDLCWAQLLSAREARFIMGCSCGAGKRPVDEAEYRRLGLMTQHAYSLLDVKQTSTGHRVVQLRNPWGSFVWLGQFSQGWPGWTPQLHRELASEANRWPGTFWMPFEQFAHFFDTVDIAQIHHRSWTTTRYQLDIGWERGKTRMVRMTVTEPTELCVVLHQRHARTSLDQVDIMVLVHRQDPSRGDAFPGELVCRSPRKIQPSVRTEDRFFRPGDYLLCVHSFTKFGDATLPGALAIHSSKTVFSELLSIPLETQQQSMCALVLQEGTVHEPFPGVISRYLTHDFAGLALMVDNLNRGSCVQTLSDCQNSTNVLSTRASLLTADSVPPLHRQIVTVLTHFEPSQAFMVTHSHRHRLVTHPQLRDFAPAAEFAGAQNYPLLVGPAVGALHSPSPLFT